MPRTSPSELTISVTTRPQPPWRFTRRRNAVSVMPAIGATTNGVSRFTEPIFIFGFGLSALGFGHYGCSAIRLQSFEPFSEPPSTFSEARFWIVSEERAGLIDVGPGLRHVA